MGYIEITRSACYRHSFKEQWNYIFWQLFQLLFFLRKLYCQKYKYWSLQKKLYLPYYAAEYPEKAISEKRLAAGISPLIYKVWFPLFIWHHIWYCIGTIGTTWHISCCSYKSAVLFLLSIVVVVCICVWFDGGARNHCGVLKQ